jgi:hypothetical protein
MGASGGPPGRGTSQAEFSGAPAMNYQYTGLIAESARETWSILKFILAFVNDDLNGFWFDEAHQLGHALMILMSDTPKVAKRREPKITATNRYP